MTIDINELRRLAQANYESNSVDSLYALQDAFDYKTILDLLDRLEAAEKELAELRSSMKFRTSLIGRTEAERNELRAKIAEMERQEPFGWLLDGDFYEVRQKSLYSGDGPIPGQKALYALPGAQPAPIVPDATVLLRRAAMALEVVGTEWRESDPTLRLDLASALAAAPEAKP